MASLKIRLGLAGGLAVLTTAIVFLGQTSGPAEPQRDFALDDVANSPVRPQSSQSPRAGVGAEEKSRTPHASGEEFRFSAPGDRRGDPLAVTPLNEAFERLIAGDYAAATRIAEPFAEQGDANARHLIGYLYERGLGVERDVAKALELYSQAATQGNTDAMLALGDLAMGAPGVTRNIDKAVGWYRMGVENNDPRAEARLGAIYADVELGRRDMVRALSLFESAAAKNDPDAHYALGVAHIEGDERPIDYYKAAEHFEAAAKAGHAPAAYNLGVIYDTPYIGPPDSFQAADWFTRAANAGYAPAMTALGLFAHRGDAPGEPADWFEKAAKAGDPQGRFLFAVALAKGDGREPDKGLARNLATEVMNDPTAEDMLKANARALIASLDNSEPSGLRLRN